MKRQMSAKVKWAIGLLIFMIISNFIYTASHSGMAIAVSMIAEYLPIIAVIVLTFYDHAYTAPKSGNFTLLRIWALVLVWVQPFLSIFSYALAGMFNAVIGYWIGSCIFPAIAFALLYIDGKNTETITQDQPTENPWYYNIVAKELEKQGIRNFDLTTVKSIWEKANVGGYTDEKLNTEVQTYKALHHPQPLFPDEESTSNPLQNNTEDKETLSSSNENTIAQKTQYRNGYIYFLLFVVGIGLILLLLYVFNLR